MDTSTIAGKQIVKRENMSTSRKIKGTNVFISLRPGGGGGVGHRVPLRAFFHRAVVRGDRKLELSVKDPIVRT